MRNEAVFEADDEFDDELVTLLPLRVLINTPVGPLPNVRLRYLADDIVQAYESAAIHQAMRDRRGRVVPRVGSFLVWLKRGRDLLARPAHLRQVGLVDRFADRPYGMRNW
jgi:hypothetical protein